MEIAQITRALQHDVVTIVFLNVLLQQIGFARACRADALARGQSRCNA